MDLYDKQGSERFYEERYTAPGSFLRPAYMDDWSREKKQRLYELLRGLALPERGEALDFGCGPGVLTEVLRQALPGYRVYGTDLCTAAIAKARARYPQGRFFQLEDPEIKGKKFDFLFTHHVLEHVYHLEPVLREMVSFLKPRAFMCHILPCGNAGSFEYRVCQLRRDGIESDKENRFYFEDEGHVRRLTSAQLHELLANYGFEPVAAFFSDQYYGALKWITESSPRFILRMCNPACGKDLGAKLKLTGLLLALMSLSLWRLPITVMNRINAVGRKTWLHSFLYAASLIFYPLSYPVDHYLRSRVAREWSQRRQEPNGSEMYLCYAR